MNTCCCSDDYECIACERKLGRVAPLTLRGNNVENQHREIKGYRELTQEEIDLMNEAKDLEAKCAALAAKLAYNTSIDQRSLALAKTNMQQGFMWLVRSIAKPTSNWL